MNTKLNIIAVLIIILAQYSLSFAQGYGSWREIDSMRTPRVSHRLVLLPNGNVLVSGGSIDSIKSSSEVYNFNNGEWRYTSPMNIPRTSHSLVLLKTGKVLTIGGLVERSCELFDPVTETWTMTDSIPTIRITVKTVTELDDGRIMVVGGYNYEVPGYLSAVDLFNPETGKWTEGAPMHYGRSGHTATKLKDGRVLVAGGFPPNNLVNDCEIYDPVNNIWEITTSLNVNRSSHAAILLKNGNVFVSGNGKIGHLSTANTCEVYDAKAKTWTIVSNTMMARAKHSIYYSSAIDKLLIVGGSSAGSDYSWEIYDPNSMQPIHLGYFPGFFDKNQILMDNNIQLQNGNIMIAGGWTINMSSGIPVYYPTNFAWIFDAVTTITQENENIDGFSLEQNCPNPFNPITTISYMLGTYAKVKLIVYDALGREVATLVNELKQEGYYTVSFDASNLPSGVYIYSLRVNGFVKNQKMTLLK